MFDLIVLAVFYTLLFIRLVFHYSIRLVLVGLGVSNV